MPSTSPLRSVRDADRRLGETSGPRGAAEPARATDQERRGLLPNTVDRRRGALAPSVRPIELDLRHWTRFAASREASSPLPGATGRVLRDLETITRAGFASAIFFPSC